MSRRTPPPPPGFDLDFRPASYRDAADPVAAILADILGEERRRLVRDRLESGEPLPDGAEMLLEPALAPADRAELVEVNERFRAGEELPPCRPGETEIARVVLEAVVPWVVSVRARRGRDGRYRYRVVDEGTPGGIEHRRHLTSRHPLKLRELIALIDSISGAGEVVPGEGFMARMRAGVATVAGPAVARESMTAWSAVYPQLADWYAREAERWFAAVTAGEGEGGR